MMIRWVDMEISGMMSALGARGKRDVVHHMLSLAFVEIRATESKDVAAKIASIFHAVPVALINCSSSEDYDKQLDDLIQRSRRVGLENYVQGLQSTAERSVLKGRGDG